MSERRPVCDCGQPAADRDLGYPEDEHPCEDCYAEEVAEAADPRDAEDWERHAE